MNLQGDQSDNNFTFSENISIKDLKPGTYHGVITLDNSSSVLQTLQVVVPDMELLNVESKLSKNSNQLHLNLTGGNSYAIQLNDITIESTNSTIELVLKEELNRIHIETDKACQGIFSDSIEIHNEIIVDPIPSSNVIYMNTKFPISHNVDIIIYDLSGSIILQRQETEINNTEINVASLIPGIYLLQLKGQTIYDTKKIVIN